MSPGLKETLQHDLTTAVRSRDEVRKRVLRVVMSYIHSAEARDATVDHPVARDLTDAEITQVLIADADRRRRVIATYESAGRDDQAAAERAELAVLDDYLAQRPAAP